MRCCPASVRKCVFLGSGQECVQAIHGAAISSPVEIKHSHGVRVSGDTKCIHVLRKMRTKRCEMTTALTT